MKWIIDHQVVLSGIFLYGAAFTAVIWLYLYWKRGIIGSDKRVTAWLKAQNFTVRDVLHENNVELHPIFPIPEFGPIILGEGKLGQYQVTLVFGFSHYASGYKPILYVEGTLQKNLPGTVLIRPSGTSWLGQLTHIKLEDTLFKNFIHVLANPRQLSTAIMSPDFMAWYEDHRPRPAIYITDNKFSVIFQDFATNERLAFLGENLSTILNYIEKSGALETIFPS